MSLDPALLDELARCFARAAVDALLESECESAGRGVQPAPAPDAERQGAERCEPYSASLPER
jgi:hypothetical protein